MSPKLVEAEFVFCT
ncbi:hypothetical protein ACXHQP_22245, partial [Vibrio chemaguriensis]